MRTAELGGPDRSPSSRAAALRVAASSARSLRAGTRRSRRRRSRAAVGPADSSGVGDAAGVELGGAEGTGCGEVPPLGGTGTTGAGPWGAAGTGPGAGSGAMAGPLGAGSGSGTGGAAKAEGTTRRSVVSADGTTSNRAGVRVCRLGNRLTGLRFSGTRPASTRPPSPWGDDREAYGLGVGAVARAVRCNKSCLEPPGIQSPLSEPAAEPPRVGSGHPLLTETPHLPEADAARRAPTQPWDTPTPAVHPAAAEAPAQRHAHRGGLRQVIPERRTAPARI